MEQDANTLNIELNGSNATMNSATDVSNGLIVTGSSTINLKSNGTLGVAANQLALTAADSQNVVITGSQALTLTTTAATGINGFSIDGSAATGTLDITGTNAIDTIIGGSADDILDGGGAAGFAAVNEVQTITLTGAVQSSGINDTVSVGLAIDQFGFIKTVTTQGVYIDYASAIAEVIKMAVDSDEIVNKLYDVSFTDNVVTFTAKGALAGRDIPTIIFNGDQDADSESATAIVEETVKGVAAKDATATADTFTGNGGADTFIITTADATSDASADVITDFATTSDKIDFGALDVAGSEETYRESTAAVADFTAAKEAADTTFAADPVVVYSAQQVGADTYIFAANAGSASAEQVVKLTGVSLNGIEFGDIIA